uniref:Protein kinase domain-containing protein n=1 Tax=Ditylenchus dipsaci TaxID=166011 RepID=A0A915CNT4_9BILA
MPEPKPPLLKIPSASLLASAATSDIQGLKSRPPLTPDVLHHHANLIAKASLPLVASTPNIPASLPAAAAATESDSSDTTPTSTVADDPSSHISFQSLLKEKGLRTTITNRTPRDFFFIKVLGEGSFSTVYFAKEVDTGDDYAIKVLQKVRFEERKK